MQSKLNKILFLLVGVTSLYAQNFKYANFDLHSLTIPKNTIFINAGYMVVNKSIDIFKMRDLTLNGSIGDLNGLALGVLYGISKNIMVSYKFTRENIKYNGNTLTNTKNDIYLRYHLFGDTSAKFNSGVSLDVGFVNNSMNNLYVTNIADINTLAKRYFPNKNVFIKQESNGALSLYNGNTYTDNLQYNPWVGLQNTSDNSLYLRALSGFHKQYYSIDFYAGVKRTKIKNELVVNDELAQIALSHGYNLQRNLNRDENMFFAGTSVAYEINNFIIEGMYEYDRFQRNSSLGYMNSNHIIDMSLDYRLTKHLLLYTSAKLMLHQLNGQIPYLYNKYTQTTYDHKYGYAKFGFVYYFQR